MNGIPIMLYMLWGCWNDVMMLNDMHSSYFLFNIVQSLQCKDNKIKKMNGMSGMSISQDNNKIFQGIKIGQ